MNTGLANRSGLTSALGPVLVVGFTAAVVVWTAWFITHLPWLGVPERASYGIILGAWLLAMGAGGAWSGPATGWKVGLGAGLTSAVLGLLLLGANQHPVGAGAPTGTPSQGTVVVGFLALGLVVGLIGGTLGGFLGRPQPSSGFDWLHRFALVTVAASVPLIVVGGLVTSTNSGMAVPDWPGTYGHNMFLFPLAGPAPEADKPYEKVFLEHSHRLFGTLLGVAMLVLTIWVWRVEPRRWVKVWAGSIFGAVVVQGLMGALRVLRDSPAVGVVHGVLAQLTVGGLVALAGLLWARPERASLAQPFANPRRVRVFATAALHTTLLQLLFGALYRHLRETHALWTHVGFSFVVLIAGILGGFWAAAVPRESGPLARALRVCGGFLVAAVLLQFLLGWAALGMGGREREAPTIAAALIRTAHQTNGAVLMSLTVATAVLAKVLYRYVVPQEPAKAA